LGQIYPAIEYANGCKEWWIHGKRHREDSPAIEWGNGMKEWWIHGKLHRADGPAVEVDDHEYKYNKWCFRGSYCEDYEFTNLLVKHRLKIQLLNQVLPPGSETLVVKYSL
jgi:hypothetical protein